VFSFESGEYNRVEKGVAKESMLTITKASFYEPSKNVKYQVIDDVTQLRSEEDWHRVVAVFVLGAAWQFSDWPKKKWANPAAIFENGTTPLTLRSLACPARAGSFPSRGTWCAPAFCAMCSSLCFLFAPCIFLLAFQCAPSISTSTTRRCIPTSPSGARTDCQSVTEKRSSPSASDSAIIGQVAMYVRSMLIVFLFCCPMFASVCSFQISKTKRHGDRSVVLDFWHILNEFIAARNASKKLII